MERRSADHGIPRGSLWPAQIFHLSLSYKPLDKHQLSLAVFQRFYPQFVYELRRAVSAYDPATSYFFRIVRAPSISTIGAMPDPRDRAF